MKVIFIEHYMQCATCIAKHCQTSLTSLLQTSRKNCDNSSDSFSEYSPISGTLRPGRRHKERRSFVKGFSRYIYSHHFTCFWHSTEQALFILDGPCAPLECNKSEERRPNHNRWFKFVQVCYRKVIWQWPKLYKGSWRRDHVPMVEQVGQMLT